MRKVWLITLVAALALTAAACSGGNDDSDGEAASAADEGAVEQGVPLLEAGDGEAVEGASGDEAVAVAQGGRSSLPGVGPRVVQTASLSITVQRNRFQETVDDARAIATGLGGFVVGSSASQGRERRLVRGSLVVRVPERSYATAMERLSRLGRVEGREETGTDVSQELVDLEARARHLEAVERQLLEFLDRAETVAAALTVQSQLNEVQLELERARGRLAFLEDQVSFATISLGVRERQVEPAEAEGDSWGIVDAWSTAAHGFVAVVGWIFVAAAIAAPIAALLALALVAARLAARRSGLHLRRSGERPSA